MNFSQPGLWKIDALFFAAAALAIALSSAIAVRADDMGNAAPAPADTGATLTAASPAAGADPSTAWDLGPHGTLGLIEPDPASLNGKGSEDGSQHPGAQ